MRTRPRERALRLHGPGCNHGVMRGTLGSLGEIVGALLVVAASIALFVAAFAYGAGDELALFVLITAFAVGITGFGVHIASREARFRRDKR